MTESYYGHANKFNKLITVKDKRSKVIMQSVDVNDPFVNYGNNKGGQTTNSKAQPIRYEEDKQEVENIDEELKIMDGIQE